MLEIVVPGGEQWNDELEEFITSKDQVLQLEHSLVSLSKWESKWKKPFLSLKEKTPAESLDYIRCMTMNKKVDPSVYFMLTKENIQEIDKYIEDPMTATTFTKKEGESAGAGKRIVTSELIYSWMITLNIPFECQKWHLNRLLTLIRVCNAENEPAKKMSKGEILRRNSALNAARRKQLHTKG